MKYKTFEIGFDEKTITKKKFEDWKSALNYAATHVWIKEL